MSLRLHSTTTLTKPERDDCVLPECGRLHDVHAGDEQQRDELPVFSHSLGVEQFHGARQRQHDPPPTSDDRPIAIARVVQIRDRRERQRRELRVPLGRGRIRFSDFKRRVLLDATVLWYSRTGSLSYSFVEAARSATKCPAV